MFQWPLIGLQLLRRVVLNAVERLAGSYDSECERIQQDLSLAESQLRDYQARLGNPFLHDAYLAELTTLRDDLKVRLSGPGPNANSGSEFDSHELARRIKALIEGRRHVSAEEPITLRIRRRTETPSDTAFEDEGGDPAARFGA